ncbi:hypothetical protein BDY19DRAFT_971922 [Irpex rosettiformis]|uniref:Uncharacterized protein n=1 Tax=Irpex rosettiformis TaxID=378272 RepID=A0ACB8TR23_9APHY|nr:hypothetical protein BDY19DRAFT_971922 [Irpex rosettiformis]
MSGLSQSEIQRLLFEQTANYTNASATVLYLFDSLITFFQEIDVIWGRKWTLMTWLHESCKAVRYIFDIFDITQYFCLALFSALRAYSLLDGGLKIIVTGVVFLLNIVPAATNLFYYVTSTVMLDSELCSIASKTSKGADIGFSLGARISAIIGDTLVLLITWSKTARSYREARKLEISSPLITLLFRNGTFCFMILLVLNVLEIAQRNVPSLLIMEVFSPFFEVSVPVKANLTP